MSTSNYFETDSSALYHAHTSDSETNQRKEKKKAKQTITHTYSAYKTKYTSKQSVTDTCF